VDSQVGDGRHLAKDDVDLYIIDEPVLHAIGGERPRDDDGNIDVGKRGESATRERAVEEQRRGLMSRLEIPRAPGCHREQLLLNCWLLRTFGGEQLRVR
jgi:hypothetical protein